MTKERSAIKYVTIFLKIWVTEPIFIFILGYVIGCLAGWGGGCK